MKKLMWILIAALFAKNYQIFAIFLVSESNFLRKFTFDNTNKTCETSSFKTRTLLRCAVFCVQKDTCLAILYDNTDRECCLLDRQLRVFNDVQPDGGNVFDYFEKSANQTKLDCKSGWENYSDSSYCFVNEKSGWNIAERICSLMGAHLVGIESEHENEWLFTRLGDYYEMGYDDRWWSGGTDGASEGSFYWQHSKQGLDFTYWNPNDPSGKTSENCVLLLFFDKWQDFPCMTESNFICEK
ncbi:C-type lectin domain family 4 member D-like [Crassostrea virginica]